MNESKLLNNARFIEGCLCLGRNWNQPDYCMNKGFGIRINTRIGDWELNQPHNLSMITRTVRRRML